MPASVRQDAVIQPRGGAQAAPTLAGPIEVVPTSQLSDDLETLNAWLRDEVPWSLADEYPTVFAESAKARSWILRHDDGTLGAHAACLDIDVAHPEGSRGRVALRLVGSVAVDPELRGQGIGTRLMDAVIDDFDASGRDLLLLWSDKPGFYERIGFEAFGEEWLVQAEAKALSSNARLRLLRVPGSTPEFEPQASMPAIIGAARCNEATDAPSEQELAEARALQDEAERRRFDRALDAMLALRDREAVHALRERADFEALLGTPEMETWLLEREGEIVAYACFGKALDFAGVIHECGGADADLLELLPAIPHAAIVLPPHRRQLAHALGEPQSGQLGLALRRKPVPEGIWLDGLTSI